ncbi:DNA adenine methyltransferase YhdJ [Roseimaritima multifibrata]|uniref:DNA adenine methyltransferase YhdJ n=1 Tax=Roseimaritima multifibrata TaxID=1930274 RepID=A0A517MM05_9BACT|nr:site-specific DNA-methyltransferase [Roseimaritima multifibrata]QDS95928.1 DNA adenine methyltransferase YhdJ [Roseimaritima multifibrata]
MTSPLENRIELGDCIQKMDAMPEQSVDLVFADPPFNIGYDYDVYDDKQDVDQYLEWSESWINAVHRVLRDDGTFWLAIGDEYAAELKVISQRIGFHCRSWVVWYYTFGVNCKHKFTRSHAHLFYFVKDPAKFTFLDEDLDNRVPSARELIYNDRRANPKGRLPDDTWMIRPAGLIGELASSEDLDLEKLQPPAGTDQTFRLRPQEIQRGFNPSEDTWYIPRVAGTFKERAGFHGCQMPEQLLGRIIRTCSKPEDLVLDPFSGSATTVAVAKKLGRRWLGFDLSESYVQMGCERLDSICLGDRLSGTAEPMKVNQAGKPSLAKKKKMPASQQNLLFREARYEAAQLELTLLGIRSAFQISHEGQPADRVVYDAVLSEAFDQACARLSIVGNSCTWRSLLLNLDQEGALADLPYLAATEVPVDEIGEALLVAEVSVRRMGFSGLRHELDQIFCDPALADRFDRQIAATNRLADVSMARLSLLNVRRHAETATARSMALGTPLQWSGRAAIWAIDPDKVPAQSGQFALMDAQGKVLYAGATLNLQATIADVETLSAVFDEGSGDERSASMGKLAEWAWSSVDIQPSQLLAWHATMVGTQQPPGNLNCFVPASVRATAEVN